MDDHGESMQSGTMLLNGLCTSEVARVTRAIDVEGWSKAEERTEELISRIQPNGPSEERRLAVADYVKRLITKCTSCKVFTYGSVPLKTYLPDGDIDLTAFSEDESLKDTWANNVLEVLENEEKNEKAEFHVKEVQYIQAEVKLIKCLVEDIVVDISFNQLGGLCTLCFLDEMDHLINHDHLFKRSIILTKAWCYYESRILGAHHGLISTYALETLVLYIFHVFNNTFFGPLEVLYRFLEFFSNFDWDNYCVSLWGPVPISSLPDMTSEPPRRDSGRLLLNKLYLDKFSTLYGVPTIGPENKYQPFVSKHFNIVDPLRINNNLGRSVSKGNFFRIRSAFTFGASRLVKLLECSKMDLIAEVDRFFMNTWERHCSGLRPDASPIMWKTVSVDITKQQSSMTAIINEQKNFFRGSHELNGLSSQPTNHAHKNSGFNNHSQSTQRKKSALAISHQRAPMSFFRPKVANTIESNNTTKENNYFDKTQKHAMTHSMEKRGRHERLHFARRNSNSELACSADEVLSHDGCDIVQDAGNDENCEYSLDNFSNREFLSSNSSRNNLTEISHFPASSMCNLSQLNVGESVNTLGSFYDEAYVRSSGKENASATSELSVPHDIHQEEQEQCLVNMLASCNMHNTKRQLPLRINFASPLALPSQPFVLTSVDNNHGNVIRAGPPSFPVMEPSGVSNIPFWKDLASPPSPYLPTSGLSSNTDEITDSANGNFDVLEKSDSLINEHNPISQPEFITNFQDYQMLHSNDLQHPQFGFVSSSKYIEEKHQVSIETDKFMGKNYMAVFPSRSSKHRCRFSDERSYSVYVPVSQASVSSSKLNSHSSVASSRRLSNVGREKRGRKVSPSPVLTYLYGRSKSDWPRDSSLCKTLTDADNETLSHSSAHHSSAYGPAKKSEHYPAAPSSTAVIHEAQDNRGNSEYVFYQTGPPVPFLTMVPVRSMQSDKSKSRGPMKNCHYDVHLGPFHDDTSNYNDHTEELDQCEVNRVSTVLGNNSYESLKENNLDILNSDFASHWENLQFGKSCQNEPLVPPSSVGKQIHFGQFSCNGAGVPIADMATFIQMNGSRLVQSPTNSPKRDFKVHNLGGVRNRYHDGTWTSPPNPKAPSQYYDSTSRGNEANYYRDRGSRW